MTIIKAIPSIITSLNLACGVIAVLSEDLRMGALFILIAAALDGLDGAAARILDAKSAMGKELDSMADVVSFGIAPAVLFYHAFVQDNHFIFLALASIIAVAGALRLARYNITDSGDSDFFQGLPIPSSGIFFTGLVLAQYYEVEAMLYLKNNLFLVIMITLGIAFLNVSRIKMFSLKQMKFKIVRVYILLISVLAILSFFVIPELILTTVIALYILVCLADYLMIKSFNKRL